jgi:hypothetical protein
MRRVFKAILEAIIVIVSWKGERGGLWGNTE